MIYKAYELLAKLRLLTLSGIDFEDELEWIGTDLQWRKCRYEEESIIRDYELSKI